MTPRNSNYQRVISVMSNEKKGLKPEDQKYVDDQKDFIRSGMASVNLTIQSATLPLTTADRVIERLTQEGKDELVDKVVNICRTITSDMDNYGSEVADLTKKVTKLFAKNPTHRRHLSNFNIESIALSQQLMDLNARILQTTVSMSTDYTNIVNQLENSVDD